MVASGELFVMAAYLSGAVCIVLFTLSVGWIIVWKCVLSKMPFVQELFDLKPTKPHNLSAAGAKASVGDNNEDNSVDEDDDLIPSSTHSSDSSKAISFHDRVEASKRVSVCVCVVLIRKGCGDLISCVLLASPEAADEQAQVDDCFYQSALHKDTRREWY